jgi:hypothetical protein
MIMRNYQSVMGCAGSLCTNQKSLVISTRSNSDLA